VGGKSTSWQEQLDKMIAQIKDRKNSPPPPPYTIEKKLIRGKLGLCKFLLCVVKDTGFFEFGLC